MDAVIVTENLTRRFGDFVAVDHLNLQVQAGQVLGYLGPNEWARRRQFGCCWGCCTRLRATPRPGLRHRGAVRAGAPRAAATCRRSLRSIMSLTAHENLAFYAGVYGVRDRRRVDEVINELGLTAQQHQRVHTLSTGWRQRLALAAAIIHRPGLLFWTSRPAAWNPVARHAFWDLNLPSWGQGIAVMVSTH